MRKFLLIGLLALLNFSAPAVAESDGDRHEILLGTSGTTSSNLTFDFNSNLSASLDVGYKFAATRMLQVGLNAGVGHIDTPLTGVTVVSLSAGPTFNFPMSSQSLMNALYATFHAGFRIYDAALISTTQAILLGEFGYRFPITSSFAWRPSVGTTKVLNGSNFVFFISPISFSAVF